MRGLSERQYARHAGLSRGAVQKAKASGRLVLHPDGSIDAAGSDARRAGSTNPAMRRPVERSDDAAVARDPGTAGGMSFQQARTANEVLKAQVRRLQVQREKGELVDRARTVALVFRLARQERDAWLAWPARIAALIAAELCVDAHAVQELLEQHVRDHLEELAEPRLELR
jgi:hypothetical protein